MKVEQNFSKHRDAIYPTSCIYTANLTPASCDQANFPCRLESWANENGPPDSISWLIAPHICSRSIPLVRVKGVQVRGKKGPSLIVKKLSFRSFLTEIKAQEITIQPIPHGSSDCANVGNHFHVKQFPKPVLIKKKNHELRRGVTWYIRE